MESLIYQQAPIVHLAGNLFVEVPTVLQYDDTPLIQVVSAAAAGFTTEIPIYHSDGTYLAKVVGSQMYLTADGKKLASHSGTPATRPFANSMTRRSSSSFGKTRLRSRQELSFTRPTARSLNVQTKTWPDTCSAHRKTA
jgi:hypothetical protein